MTLPYFLHEYEWSDGGGGFFVNRLLGFHWRLLLALGLVVAMLLVMWLRMTMSFFLMSVGMLRLVVQVTGPS